MALQRLAVNTDGGVVGRAVVDDQGDVLAAAGLQAGGDAGGGKPAGWVTLMLLVRCLSWAVDGDGGGDGVPSSSPRLGGRVGVADGTRIQSVSNVEMVNTLISASASGCEQRGQDAGQRRSRAALDGERGERPACWAFFGTLRAAQTTLVSRAVAVIENSDEDSAQAGTSAPGPSRTTASFSGNCSRVRGSSRARSWRQSHRAEAGLLGQARGRGSCTARRLRRCPWRGCRRRRPRPAGRPASSSVTCRCTLLEPMTDLVAGHWPSGSRCTNGSSAYAFS